MFSISSSRVLIEKKKSGNLSSLSDYNKTDVSIALLTSNAQKVPKLLFKFDYW